MKSSSKNSSKKLFAFTVAFGAIMFASEACQQNSGNNATPASVGNISCNTSGTVRSTTPTQVSATGANTMPISFCSASVNLPCVSVTICSPGAPTTCQTIGNILLDTGSFGLRIFSSLVTTVTPTQETSGGKNVAECALFGTGSTWGPVVQVLVQLGGETSTLMPIQLINSSYPTMPSVCSQNTPLISPATAGFNGILGIGPFGYDCGASCSNPVYYQCSAGTCNSFSAGLALQVINPVYALTQDNNGVIIALPGTNVPGSASLSGTFIMGIGTQANNTASGLTAYPMNGYMEFTTQFNGTNLTQSFIDSGSNAFSFPGSPGLTNCTYNNGWYCPAVPACFTSTLIGSTGTPTGTSLFRLDAADTIFSQGVLIAPTVGNTLSSSMPLTFDWGLPFFLGRAVYVGFQGRAATGISITGPYWAF